MTADLLGVEKKDYFVLNIATEQLTVMIPVRRIYRLERYITERYPDQEKWIPYRRFRGVHRLWRDEHGRELCVACELCSGICPTDCITVIPEEDDTGRGIAPDVKARIFEPGFTTKEGRVGMGLGLAISQQIIDHHGGRISVESELGEGTSFTVDLHSRLPANLED